MVIERARLLGQGRKSYVYTVNKDGKVERPSVSMVAADNGAT